MIAGEKSILFVCIENSSRSQMAEAFARELGLNATSGGTVPSTQVNSLVVDAMREVGIDISRSKPKELTDKMIEQADLVVLTDASLDKAIPGNLRRKMRRKVVEWYIPDPQGKTIEEIRNVRDEIKGMVEAIARDASLRQKRQG